MSLSKEDKQKLHETLEKTGKHRLEFNHNRYPDWYMAYQNKVDYEVIEIPVEENNIPVKLHISKAKNRKAGCPVHINFHGGGYVFGQGSDDDMYCARVADEIEGIVVDADYCSAFDHPFPAAFEQSKEVVRYVFAHCKEWNADPKGISIGGQSAGGALSAGVALYYAKTGEYHFCLLVLTYAALKNELKGDPSEDRGAALSMFYCDGNPQILKDPFCSPYYADDTMLKGMPNTLFVNAYKCPFRESNLEFANRLINNGVTVTARTFMNSTHAFTIRMTGNEWKDSQDLIIQSIRNASENERV